MNSPSLAADSQPIPRQGRRSGTHGHGRARRVGWLLPFLGFFLLCGGWALAAPYDASPDEIQHIIRAVGVARGEIAPTPTAADMGTGAFQHVPASLLRQNCWMFQTGSSAACATPPGGDSHIVKASSRAGRYNPLYYLLVGWPMALWPTMKGVLLARLVSAALTAAFLAAAANAALNRSGHRLMAAGVLVAVTPITVHLSGSINPNGLEIAAAVALFTALIPVALASEGEVRRADAVQIALAGATLVSLRSLGPAFGVAIFGVLLFPIARTRLAGLLRSRSMRWATLAAVLAAVLGAGWTVVMKASELGVLPTGMHLTFFEAFRYEAVARVSGYINEMIGVPSWLDTPMPGWAYTVWELLVGALVIPAFALGRWADRWRLAAITLGALAVAVLPDALGADKYGFVAQGRYVLPLMVGLPILAAWLIGRRGILDAGHGARLTRWVALIVLPMQLLFLSLTMVRWQTGLVYSPTKLPLNPLRGTWHPMVGSPTALGAAVLGCAGLLFWIWSGTRAEAASRTDA